MATTIRAARIMRSPRIQPRTSRTCGIVRAARLKCSATSREKSRRYSSAPGLLWDGGRSTSMHGSTTTSPVSNEERFQLPDHWVSPWSVCDGVDGLLPPGAGHSRRCSPMPGAPEMIELLRHGVWDELDGSK